MKRLRILHVWNDFPIPPHHGGRIDLWGRVRALHELGHEVDAVATVKALPDPSHYLAAAKHVRNITFVRRYPNPFGIVSREPLQLRTRRRLADLKLTRGYDVVLLEQEYVAPALDAPHLECGRVILRVHNDEPAYYLDLAQSEECWWRRLYYLEEARRFRRTSPRVLERAHELWFISYDHWQRWRASHPYANQRTAWLPAALPGPLRPAHSGAGERVLITGNLFQPTNLEGLEWFLNEVHPWLLRRPHYELCVAGSTRGACAHALLKRLCATPRVQLHLNSADLDPLYRSAAIFVNPMQRGVSVKLKTLDAICHGLPVVSTAAGLDGAGLESGRHVVLATGGVAMAEAIARLLEAPDERRALVENAQDFLAKHYNQRANLERLLGAPGEPPEGEPAVSSRHEGRNP